MSHGFEALEYVLNPEEFTFQSPELWKACGWEPGIGPLPKWTDAWEVLGKRFRTGTDYDPNVLKVEVQTLHSDGDKNCVGTALPDEMSNPMNQALAIQHIVMHASKSKAPMQAFIANTMCAPDARSPRPMLTMIVSSPVGGADIAEFIYMNFANHLQDVTMAVRTIRNGTATVLKIGFFPEIYSMLGISTLAIDWDTWWDHYEGTDLDAMNTAILIWIDNVSAVLRDLLGELVIPSMQLLCEAIFFDYCQSAAFVGRDALQFAMTNPVQIVARQVMGAVRPDF